MLNIYQDSRGFIWLCTRGGLSRYDGNRFTNFTTANGLTNDMVNDIFEIEPQKFIIAQNSDGPRLLYNEGISAFGDNPQLTVNRFHAGKEKDMFGITDQHGIMRLQNDGFRPVNASFAGSIERMAIINDSVWAVIQLLRSLQLVTSTLLPYSITAPAIATAVYKDSKHRVWLGTAKGLQLLSPEQHRNKPIAFIPLPPAFDLPVLRESYITSFIEDSRGNYWVGTNTGLVYIQQDGHVAVYTEADGLPSPAVNCVVEDQQHNIWIGTPLGLAKISLLNPVKTFTRKDGLSQLGIAFVLPVAAQQVLLFANNRSTNFNLQTGILHNNILLGKNDSILSVFKLSDQRILVEKPTGPGIYNQAGEFKLFKNWPAGRFTCVAQLTPDTFICSAKDKIFIVSNGRLQEKLFLDMPDAVSVIRVTRNGIILVGTTSSGLYKLKWSKNVKGDSLALIDTVNKRLPDAHIRAMYADKDDEIWLGTRYKGVIRLTNTGNAGYVMQTYGIEQGLSSDFVRTINADKKNNIWAGTMQGIDKLTPAGNQYRVFNFGKVNKIFSQIFDIVFLEDDYLLAAGFPYLVYARDNQQDTMAAPSVYITKVYSMQSGSPAVGNDQQNVLAYNKAQIYFEFSAPQFINEKVTAYFYRLTGSSDTNWTLSGKSQSVYYASLRPGDYSFEVKVMGFNGQWGKTARHHFVVETAFWQRPWFIGCIILAAALVAYIVYRYRIKQLLRLQQVRNRIATDLHDEIGSILTNISILSTLSRKNLSNSQKAGEFLQRISEEVADSSQSLDDIIWSVDASHDSLDETVSRMRRYAAELFDVANISYDLQLDPLFEQRKLLMEQRRDIYLLYKEAVNNIFKHAEAKQVLIKVSIEARRLVVLVQDDGRGFDTELASGRHGLKGMKARVRKWGGTIQFISSSNTGTSVDIRLPLAT